MKLTKTERGFNLIKFKDAYDFECSIQESSAASEEHIWLGVDDPKPRIMACNTPQGGTGWVPYDIPGEVLISSRMHLNRAQVKALLPHLKRFTRTGRLARY